MGWKSTARRVSSDHLRRKAADEIRTFHTSRTITRHGRPFVTRDFIADYCEEYEDGTKFVAASTKFHRGEYIFPLAWVHVEKQFVGETKDIRFNGEQWEIKLDAVLRDASGEPILHDGLFVDLSGWYPESVLRDAQLGMIPVKPNQTAPSEDEIVAAREARMRRNRRR